MRNKVLVGFFYAHVMTLKQISNYYYFVYNICIFTF